MTERVQVGQRWPKEFRDAMQHIAAMNDTNVTDMTIEALTLSYGPIIRGFKARQAMKDRRGAD